MVKQLFNLLIVGIFQTSTQTYKGKTKNESY